VTDGAHFKAFGCESGASPGRHSGHQREWKRWPTWKPRQTLHPRTDRTPATRVLSVSNNPPHAFNSCANCYYCDDTSLAHAHASTCADHFNTQPYVRPCTRPPRLPSWRPAPRIKGKRFRTHTPLLRSLPCTTLSLACYVESVISLVRPAETVGCS